MSKLKDGQQVTINIPFTYTIGDEGFNSGNVLWTIEDCKNEVLAEISNGVLDEGVIMEEDSNTEAWDQAEELNTSLRELTDEELVYCRQALIGRTNKIMNLLK